MQHRLLCFSALVACAAPHWANAQEIFSPGPLSDAHKNLEGEKNCLRCHAAGMKTPQQTCMKCHQDVRGAVELKRGLHGHIPPEKLQCETCHQEHLGRNNDLMPWGNNRSSFDHRLTGWTLEGAHARVRCEQCHTKKKTSDNTPIYTGLNTQCIGCHFDEHRGQEDKVCERCHTPRAWKPVPSFDHGRTEFPLTGKHQRVKCGGCHPQVRDTATSPNANPAPVHATFAKYQNIPHSACTDCHSDPHRGKFGAQCTACHTTESWNVVVGNKVKDISFHDQTRFPLQGAHTTVFCRSCHGPFGNKPANFTNMKFGACEDCHSDAHEGQFPASPGHDAPACAQCHTVAGFVPTTFGATEHGKTRFPLRGAHAAVACAECHREDPALLEKVNRGAKALLRQEGRPLLTSDTVFDSRKALDRCDSCHQDPHGGQFTNQVARSGCADCHRESSFHDLNFDHNTESRFKLTGAHLQTPCAGCHTVQEIPGGVVTTFYKPLEGTCASCHVDIHAGQMRDAKTGATACELCHVTDSFKPASKFKHNDPKMSLFPLDGAHVSVPCDACHLEVQISSRTTVRRYKPLPSDCGSCHADYHKGALSQVPQWAGQGVTPCAHCHTTRTWSASHYPEHAETPFALVGQHTQTPCISCHTRDFAGQISPRCDACHRDAHAGEMGLYCSSCHTSENWEALFDAQAHRQTVFPLRGAHGAIPCQECHLGAFSNNFRGTAATCDGCHASDYLRAGMVSINHVASQFSTNCRECHDPWAFQRGRLPDHDTCFPITSGAHSLVFCPACHTTLAGAVDNGKCATGTFNCTGCHSHNQSVTDTIHANLGIAGYVYNNQNCYACHPQGT